MTTTVFFNRLLGGDSFPTRYSRLAQILMAYLRYHIFSYGVGSILTKFDKVRFV